VDTQGLVIKAKVHPADLHDKEGAKLLLAPLAGPLPRMVKVWADSSYQGVQKWLEGNLGVRPRGSKTLVDRTTLGMGA
jgi:putative transposase